MRVGVHWMVRMARKIGWVGRYRHVVLAKSSADEFSTDGDGELPGIPRCADGEPVPAALFDPDFYVQTFPAAQNAEITPREHFARHGRMAGAPPSIGAARIAPAIELRARISATPMDDLLKLLPRGHRGRARSSWLWDRLRSCIHPSFYAAQWEKDDPDAWVEGDLDDAMAHFLAVGVWRGARVCSLFHEEWYRRELDLLGFPAPEPGQPAFFHWLVLGWKWRVVPTPMFDESFYADSYPSLGHPWKFLHYLRSGCYEAQRVPTPFGKMHDGTLVPDAQESQFPLHLPRMMKDEEPAVLRQTSALEASLSAAMTGLRGLASPKMRELVEKAGTIEPLIHQPNRARRATYLPHVHPKLRLMNCMESVRRSVSVGHVDTVVLAPHCRMAGSARVTGELTRALRAAYPEQSVLVVTTDLSDFERPDWFDSRAQIFDLNAHLKDLAREQRLAVLLDVLRGLTPSRVVNVNSRLGWDLLQVYGRQLSAMTVLGTYLFTWDLDARGHRAGYPIREFQDCFPHLDWVLLDNDSLKQELVARYLMPGPLRDRLVVARTPVSATELDVSAVFQSRRERGLPLRAIWAGRFDRQKRFDLALALAERMPEIELHVWGKPVLGGLEVDLERLPHNVYLHGTFHHFDDLPLHETDLLLYTSEWDGMPTILLDAATRGMAVLASEVGGVGELVTEETGFPVKDALSVGAYEEVLRRMSAEPHEVTLRARRLRQRVAEQYHPRQFLSTIRNLEELQRGDKNWMSP